MVHIKFKCNLEAEPAKNRQRQYVLYYANNPLQQQRQQLKIYNITKRNSSFSCKQQTSTLPENNNKR